MNSSFERNAMIAVIVIFAGIILFNFVPLFTMGFRQYLINFEFGMPAKLAMTALPILMLAVWIVVMIWVYRDAESRGMSGLLWALLIFLGNIIGLIIYLIVRNDHDVIAATNQQLQNYREQTMACPACSKPVSDKFDFCPHCGNKMKSACGSCGKPAESAWKVCPYCGDKLQTEQQEQSLF